MAKAYHVMKRAGSTVGATKDAPRYDWKRFDVVEAPKTEFDHLGDDKVTVDSEKEAAAVRQKLKEEALGK